MGTVDRLDDLVGRRVALRHRLGSGLLTDAVGELAADDGSARRAHPARRGPGGAGGRGGGAGGPAAGAAAGVVGSGRPGGEPVRRRLARAGRPAARGLAAAGDRRVHGAGERGGGRRRPGGSGSGGAGGRPRVRRTSTGWRRACTHRSGRRGTGPWRARAGCSTPATRRARRSRCWWPTWTGSPRLHDMRHRRRGDAAVQGVVLTDRPDAAWWALSLGRDPTPDERWVLDPAGHVDVGVPATAGRPRPERRHIRGAHRVRERPRHGRGPGRRRRRPRAPVPARRPAARAAARASARG